MAALPLPEVLCLWMKGTYRNEHLTPHHWSCPRLKLTESYTMCFIHTLHVLFIERISITLQRRTYFDILVSRVEDIPYELKTLDSRFTLSTCFLYTASLSLPAAGKMTLVSFAISLAVASLQIEVAFFLPAQLPTASQHLRKKNLY